MAKILLVEDDQSLREIYSIRLTAEGYEIVTAGDGEEALAVAVKERPDLVLSDVMMPKISGFDMLDILRSTPETEGIKVIMMTALSSEDQRQRGENLGADRYLVKSQVGIEDVVNAVHEVMDDSGASALADTSADTGNVTGGDNVSTQSAPTTTDSTAISLTHEAAAPALAGVSVATEAQAAPVSQSAPQMSAQPAMASAASAGINPQMPAM